EKATVSAFASLAAGIAGGLVGGDTSSAANAGQAGKTTVENNYLSDSEHRQKTSLELKEKQGKITEVEQQKLAELRIKDTETTQRLLDSCAGGVSPECTAARKDAFETIDTYVSLTYQNPKTAQAGYQEIERLLNSTSPEAQQAYNLLESYTEAFKNFGYTDEEARTRAGMYVGSIYLLGGMSAVANSGALVKQFGKDVAKPNVVPPKGNQVIDGSNTTKPGVTSPKDSNIIANKNQLPDWVNDIKTPNSRHNFNSINQKTTTKELNTVIDNSVDVAKDMAAIKNGEASIKGNTITVNNRTYERKESGVLYPVSGDGFTTLTRAEFKALGVYKQFGDTQKARDILTNMNTSSEAKIKALDTWKRNQK
ncbi:VENN motif pre-toxin domain-containing protein, partial [Providencia rettgeri]